MTAGTPVRPGEDRARAAGESWRYVAPFAVLILLLGIGNALGIGPQWAYPARTLAAVAVLCWGSRPLLDFRTTRPWSSVLLGVAVFVIWIGPDLLWSGYRGLWLFSHPLTGAARTPVSEGLRADPVFLAFRVAGSALVVPVVEELFWRAWLMRWLIAADFAALPLGSYAARAFWVTAALFAAEHGPYWDVGLAAGVAYNWWMVRTRRLADCILAHAVTNACLAAYVLRSGAWQYWL